MNKSFLFSVFAVFLLPILETSGQRIKHLNEMVSEYGDSSVILFIFSSNVLLDPITSVPIRIYHLEKITELILLNRWNWKTRHPYHNFSIFLLFPEQKYKDCRKISRYFEPLRSQFPHLSKVYVHVLTGGLKNIGCSDFILRPLTDTTRSIELLSIYFLVEIERKGFVDVYHIGNWLIKVSRPFLIPKIQKEPSRMSSCILGGGLASCRKYIDIYLNLFWYGGEFLIETEYYAGEVLDLHFYNNGSHLYPLSNIFGQYFNSPFENKYKDGKRDNSRYKVGHIMTYFAFGGLNSYIYLPTSDHLQNLGTIIDTLFFFTSSRPSIFSSIQVTLPSSERGTRKEPVLPHSFSFNFSKSQIIIPTGSKFMRFVTCDGVRSKLGFSLYITPYDSWSWIGILSFVFLIIPSFVYFLYKWRPPIGLSMMDEVKFILNTLWFDVSLVLENGPTIPHILSRLSTGETSINWMLCIWALMSIILVNAYKGIVTTELTANSGHIQKYTRMNETTGFLFLFTEGTEMEFPEVAALLKHEVDANRQYNILHLKTFLTCSCYSDVSEIIPKVCDPYFTKSLCATFQCIGEKNCKTECAAVDTCETVESKLGTLGGSLNEFPSTSRLCSTFSNFEKLNSIMDYYRANRTFPKLYLHQSIMIKDGKRYPGYNCGPETFVFGEINSSVPFGTTTKPFKNATFMMGRHSREVGMSPYSLPGVIQSITDCHKLGYLDYEEGVDALIGKAEEDLSLDVKFMKGKEKLFEKMESLRIGIRRGVSRAAFEKLNRKLLDLVAHGIYQIWGKWSRILNPTDDELILLRIKRQIQSPSPLTLKSNILTIFITCFTLSLIGIILFIIEILSKWFNTLWILMKSIQV